MEEVIEEEKNIYELFRISVLIKGAISLAEVVVGIAVLFIPTDVFLSFSTWLVTLIPNAYLSAHLLAEVLKYTSGTALFLSAYLLSRGLVKVFLIWALLKNKLWAYPASLVVLTLFVLYQVYQIITQHSLFVIGITLFDLVVMYFIWREYQIVRAHQAPTS